MKLFNFLEESIKSEIAKIDIESILPFFTFDEPFSKLLIALAQSNFKVNSIFNKIGIGKSYGYKLIDELIANDVLRLINSRESSFKIFPKQIIKKRVKRLHNSSKTIFY